MEYNYLSLEVENGLAVMTMNRPPGNALSLEFVEELDGMVSDVAADENIRCLLIKSALEKAYMVGADLKTLPPDLDLGQLDPSWSPEQTMGHVLSRMSGHIAEMLEKAQGVMNKLEKLQRPTIAAINGHALGGGLEFSLACDFRLMSRGGPRTGLSELSLGLIPAAGGCQRLPRIIGRAKAMDMIFRAKRLDADQAETIGLVHRAVDPDKLDSEAMELARELAGAATVAVECAKKAILVGEYEGLGEGLTAERDGIARLAQTSDLVKGIMAFNARTEPHFEGK